MSVPAAIAGVFEPADAAEPRVLAHGFAMSARGKGPSCHRDGAIRVVADASFHDHDALARALGEPPEAPPARLIAAAYRARGGDCVADLDGDFAFAIHDASRHVLFCARDHFGVRPFYYRFAAGRFAFASSVGSLREITDDRFELSDRAVADFVLGRVSDADNTFFRDVRRLPAAHSMVVKTGLESPGRYWTLRADPAAAREARPAARFRELFEDAVHRRMRRSSRPAALLSGGLDSSSIACSARDRSVALGRDLPTYSLFFNAPERCNERRFIDAVLSQGGFEPTIMERDGYRPFAQIEDVLKAMDGPVLAPNLACMNPLIDRVAADGTDVILDGHGGDEVVSHGYGRLDDLAKAGDWIALWREAAAAADNFGKPTGMLVRSVARRHGRIDARLLSAMLGLAGRGHPARARLPHLLRRDFIESCDLSAQRAATCPPDAGEAAQHLATLADPLQPYAFEVLARFYRSHGLEARFPFWDRRLVEFCAGLPGSAKLDRGWSRLVLREAMAGVIPEEVRTRRDKVDFAFHLASGMTRHHDEFIRDLLEDGHGPIGQYVDLPAARRVYAGIAEDPAHAPGPHVQKIWRIVTLAAWLRMTEAQGSPAGAQSGQPVPSLAGTAG